MNQILLGSTFPLTLIRRNVRIEPVGLEDLLAAALGTEVVSFWGHANTMAVAEDLLGFSVAPAVERPAITLSPEGFPTLANSVFTDCWILSPEYRRGFRPAIGAEVTETDIVGWQVLHLHWE